jgi:hypothetical protein
MATVIFKALGGKAEIHASANDPKGAFKALSMLQELFSEEKCGCCNSENIFFNVRPVDNGEYYEMKCRDCNAQLSFGQHKTGGTLFVKRWDKDNHAPMPNGGWYIYQGGNQQQGGYQGAPQQGGYQQPQQGGYQQGAPQQQYPQQGGHQPQQGGWGQQRQQPPMNPPPAQSGDIPF